MNEGRTPCQRSLLRHFHPLVKFTLFSLSYHLQNCIQREKKVKLMDSADKNVSSSPNKPPQVPKSTMENDKSCQEMVLIMQNPKKPTATTKHFMSPTILAAAEVYLPRKKILAERNESLHTHLEKTPTFDSKTSESNEFCENEENSLVDDLSSKPHGPITNSLSPRPKFLRYKPNRRRELILQRENEVKESNDWLSISGSGSLQSIRGIDGEVDFSSSGVYPESDLKQQGEESDGSEEEIQEVEMERSWGLRGVLKFLLLLVVLVLFSSYISSMNSSTPSPVVQAVMSLKDGYLMIQDHVCVFAKSIESGKHLLVGREMGVDTCGNEEEGTIEEENSDEWDEVEEIKKEKSEAVDKVKGTVNEFAESEENEAMDTVEQEENGATEELGDIVELQYVQSEAVETVEHEEKGAIEELADWVAVQVGENTGVKDLEIIEAIEVSNQLVVNSELQETEGVDMPEIQFLMDKVDCQDPVSGVSDNLERVNELSGEPITEDMIRNEMGIIWNISDDCAEHEIPIDEADGSPRKGIVDLMETDLIWKLLFQVFIFSSIIASLVLGFHFNRKRNARKDNSPFVKPCFESVISKECKTVLASEEGEHNDHLALSENAKSLINSIEEGPREMNQRRAPSVAFLGEIEVEEMSNSLRNCDMKSTTIESEVSSHSVSIEKRVGIKAYSVPAHVQPAPSDISTVNSTTYTRFSTEKKIVKKEEGGDDEVRKVVTTPVRRSSRIRNRAIASP